jgi:NIMA (never in mitosis gene a)-related kinase
MEKYQKIRAIGEGSFGKAYLVKNSQDNQMYVMKQISITQMSKKERDEALNEIKVLSALNHPNIVRYRESFVEKTFIAIIMDYAEGGTIPLKG